MGERALLLLTPTIRRKWVNEEMASEKCREKRFSRSQEKSWKGEELAALDRRWIGVGAREASGKGVPRSSSRVFLVTS
jgi:hypothetical protein